MENSHEANDQPFVIFHAFCAPFPSDERAHILDCLDDEGDGEIYVFLFLSLPPPCFGLSGRKTRSLAHSTVESFSSTRDESESCAG